MKTLDEFLKEKLDDPAFFATWEKNERWQESKGIPVSRCDVLRRYALQRQITHAVLEILGLLRSGVTPEDCAEICGISIDQTEKIDELGKLLAQEHSSDLELAQKFNLPVSLIEDIREALYPLSAKRTARIKAAQREDLYQFWMRIRNADKQAYEKWFVSLAGDEQDLIRVWHDRQLKAQRRITEAARACQKGDTCSCKERSTCCMQQLNIVKN